MAKQDQRRDNRTSRTRTGARPAQARTDGRDQAGRFAPGKSGNPNGSKQPKGVTVEDLARADAWVGRRTGMGVRGLDKGADGEFCVDPVLDTEAADMWRSDPVFKRIVETPPDEMYREGYEFSITDDKDTSTKVTTAMGNLSAIEHLTRAKQYERAYGGAAIFPVLNDGTQDLALPLNEKRIRDVSCLHVLEPRELSVMSWYDDITKPKYRLPKTYLLNPIAPGGGLAMGATTIHESRLIIWRGTHVTHRAVGGILPGWGDNVATLVKVALQQFGMSHRAIGTLIADFAQAVFKMQDLAKLMATGQVSQVKARLMMIELSRSIVNGVMIDANESYGRESTSVTGLPDLVDRVAQHLAAAANMPLTLMLGQSPKGLGNEGESDLKWWHRQIGGLQKNDTPKVKRLHEIVMSDLNGPTKGQLPKSWGVEWKALDQPSELEDAQARLAQAQIDQIYIMNSVVSADDVATSRFGGEVYSYTTHIDWDARAKQQAEMAAAEAEMAAANPASAPTPGAPVAEEPAPAAPKADETAGRMITIKEHQRILKAATRKDGDE